MRQKLVSGMSSGQTSALSNWKHTIDSAAVKLGNVHGTNQGNYGHTQDVLIILSFLYRAKHPERLQYAFLNNGSIRLHRNSGQDSRTIHPRCISSKPSVDDGQ